MWVNEGMSKRYYARTDTVSQSVRSFAYESGKRTLDIEFPSREFYRYFDVTKRQFDEMIASGSIGTYVNTHIKPNHRFEKL